jgi:hypothetical protein
MQVFKTAKKQRLEEQVMNRESEIEIFRPCQIMNRGLEEQDGQIISGFRLQSSDQPLDDELMPHACELDPLHAGEVEPPAIRWQSPAGLLWRGGTRTTRRQEIETEGIEKFWKQAVRRRGRFYWGRCRTFHLPVAGLPTQ